MHLIVVTDYTGNTEGYLVADYVVPPEFSQRLRFSLASEFALELSAFGNEKDRAFIDWLHGLDSKYKMFQGQDIASKHTHVYFVQIRT